MIPNQSRSSPHPTESMSATETDTCGSRPLERSAARNMVAFKYGPYQLQNAASAGCSWAKSKQTMNRDSWATPLFFMIVLQINSMEGMTYTILIFYRSLLTDGIHFSTIYIGIQYLLVGLPMTELKRSTASAAAAATDDPFVPMIQEEVSPFPPLTSSVVFFVADCSLRSLSLTTSRPIP